jgi:hypothetical protein
VFLKRAGYLYALGYVRSDLQAKTADCPGNLLLFVLFCVWCVASTCVLLCCCYRHVMLCHSGNTTCCCCHSSFALLLLCCCCCCPRLQIASPLLFGVPVANVAKAMILDAEAFRARKANGGAAATFADYALRKSAASCQPPQ